MAKLKDISGKRYGNLVVLEHWESISNGKTHKWLCRCDCGETKTVDSNNLKSGRTVSCGCINRKIASETRKRYKTHGSSFTPEYRTWLGMKTRCHNENDPNYVYYGARGIKVCSSWKDSFENFYEDMGERPSDNHSIDRIDVNGDYEPGNCRWATASEQRRNTRKTRYVTHGGEKYALKDLTDQLDVKYDLVLQRLNAGWELEDCFKPSNRRKTSE